MNTMLVWFEIFNIRNKNRNAESLSIFYKRNIISPKTENGKGKMDEELWRNFEASQRKAQSEWEKRRPYNILLVIVNNTYKKKPKTLLQPWRYRHKVIISVLCIFIWEIGTAEKMGNTKTNMKLSCIFFFFEKLYTNIFLNRNYLHYKEVTVNKWIHVLYIFWFCGELQSQNEKKQTLESFYFCMEATLTLVNCRKLDRNH